MNNLHLVILLAIIILNIGFSYKFFAATLYGDSYDGIESEINKIFSNEYDFYNSSVVFKEVGDILKQQEGIENSYVMTSSVTYTYYATVNLFILISNLEYHQIRFKILLNKKIGPKWNAMSYNYLVIHVLKIWNI